jgi:Protein of unknown function (DUF998)
VTLSPALSIAGSVAFAGLVLWLHLARPDLRPALTGVSHYAVGTTRSVTTAAFLALAVAVIAAAVAAGYRSPSGITWGPVLLTAAGLGAVTVALVPVSHSIDASWQRSLHTLGALVLFCGSAGGSLMLSTEWSVTLTILSWFQIVTLALFLAGMGGVPGLFHARGWLQRSVFASLVMWLIIAGWYLGHAPRV